MKTTAYHSKEPYLLERVKGRTVLHLGCVGETDAALEDRVQAARNSLHQQITTTAANVVGIDYSRDVIERYRADGLFTNILWGDVEHLEDVPLEQTFDVIVAGDIIEHLSNPGLFLSGVRRFARPDTQFILTTPNAFGLPAFVRYARNKFREGAEHVLCFNAENLANLLQRHGWTIDDCFTCYQGRSTAHTLFRFGKWLLQAFPKFGGTLGVTARLSG
jgi:2-polyprenyl-3-methyl-5-hydroxy-6-metoxy-1,4-benzoquinol methylase